MVLTVRVMAVCNFAADEAESSGFPSVGTEHLLLALLRLTNGVGIQVLRNLGLDLGEIEREVRALASSPPILASSREPPLTKTAERVLARAIQESSRLGHCSVGTEHFLLGLMHSDSSIASFVLRSHDLTLERVREEVVRFLGTSEGKEMKQSHLIILGPRPSRDRLPVGLRWESSGSFIAGIMSGMISMIRRIRKFFI